MIEMAEASNKKMIIALVGAGTMLVAVLGVGAWMALRPQGDTAVKPQLADDDIAGLIARVGELIVLPAGEEPTVASVADVEQLKNQQFFANAQIGDRVLIYAEAKKAFLYRPTEHRLIEVAPVVLDPNATSSAQPVDSVTFIIRNATTRSGLTTDYVKVLNGAVANAIVVDKDNASTASLAQSILVDLTGQKAAEAQQYAEVLGLSVGELPEGEVAPAQDADFMIVLGQDAIDRVE